MSQRRTAAEARAAMAELRQHPAALAAESDLVKLTREFESLRQQLEANLENENNLENEIGAAVKQIESIRRSRRVLNAHLENVKELLSFR